MRRRATIAFAAGMAAVAALSVGLLFAAGATASRPAPANRRVCGVPAGGHARCLAIRHYGKVESADKGGGGHKPGPSLPPVSYGAAELEDAYGLTAAAASNGEGRTVAIVDAYDDPNAYGDLAQYRSAEGLPAIARCDVTGPTGPCFAKVNQSGAEGPYPAGNTSWAEEISLDLDAVSATCPRCNILLVEAGSSSLFDLGEAVETAAAFGPVAIGNSYGAEEFSLEELFAVLFYDHPGIAVTAAAGDGGYGVYFPAAAESVIAVGGTSLRESSGAWTETVWSGTGSGCSAYIPKPAWQSDTGCPRRTVADVAALADPNTGFRVYDTYNEPGWLVFGGTSVSAQVIAGVYGLVGHGASDARALYGNGAIEFGSPNDNLTDVTSGSNGSCTHGHRDSSRAYLCTGVTGYDGPTGMGTPAGLGAF
ncbi:MAG: peptidase S8 [Chloroflexota bacterium]